MSILKSLLANILAKRERSDTSAQSTALPRHEEMPDQRFSIYDDLHHSQLVEQERQNHHSGQLILSRLFRLYRPRSILDVGCGIGTWLAAARKLGVADVFGVDGHWLDKKLAKIPAALLRTYDLEQKYSISEEDLTW